MTRQKTIVHITLLGIAVFATLFSHIGISSGQNAYSAASTLLKVFSDQDIYSATALLRVLPPETSPTPSPDIMNRQVQNYVKTILCEKIVAEILCPEKDSVISKEWKKEILEKHPDIVEKLLREVHVRQLPGTDFISISLEGRDRFHITEIVNEIAEVAAKDARGNTEASIAKTLKTVEHECTFLKK